MRQPAGIGLALAGGGPLGAIWEIGALCALQETLPALDLNALDGYVGVSAGAFVAAGLANGMTPRQLCDAFIGNAGPRGDRIAPNLFYRPALGEWARRMAGLPWQLARAGTGLALRRRSLLTGLEALGAALPAGLFSQAPLQAQLRRMFAEPGRSNDFRQLRQRLVIVATDLDSGDAAPFGSPDWPAGMAVPISQAVAASAALPGLFPPERIGRRWYVDGALKKTLHARMLLDMPLGLVLCLNPLVPFHVDAGARRPIPPLVRGGLPTVLSQTFRTMIHSRLEIGLQGYAASHPGADILLLEPDHRDPELFLANLFDVSRRRRLAEHAYQHTRAELRRQHAQWAPRLHRHGLQMDLQALADPRRRLLARDGSAAGHPASMLPAAQRLHAVLDELQLKLPPAGR